MQIILKSRFQFPHWVMKNVLFPKVITIFKLIYLFWFKMEQTLSTRFTWASASACFLPARFQGVVLLGWEDLLIPRHFQRLITGKLTGVDLGIPRNLQRRKVEVTRWPKKSNKTTNSNQHWIQEEPQKQHSNHHGGLHMTEQFKLVTNAQEGEIFKSNVTAIKIKCSNSFPRRYIVEITYTSLE